MGASSRRAAARPSRVRLGHLLVWGVLPGSVAVLVAYAICRATGVDFDANVWRPAEAVLAGRSPYPEPDAASVVKPFFLYPPLLLGIDLPLSVFPHDVARVLFAALTFAGVLGGLRLAGVTDRRVLCWAALSYPVADAVLLGNPTPLLVPAVAAAWVWRDRWWAVGLAVGLAGAFKLLLWPLGVWLIATRRWRGAAAAAVCAIAAMGIPWALIGFDGFRDYPDVARLYERLNGGPRAMTLAGLVHEAGGSWTLGHLAQRACGLVILGAAVTVGRSRRVDADRRCFSLVLAAALILSPVVWVHYLALLLVPLALARPSFGAPWAGLCALWAFPLLPHRDALLIRVDGRHLAAAGPVPTIPQLCVVLGSLAYLAVVTGGDTLTRRRTLPESPDTPAPAAAPAPSPPHAPPRAPAGR